MAIRLYLDEDVRPLLARVLRDRGVDCVSTHEAQNLELTDQEQLAFAAGEGRVIVTFNIKDFVPLAQASAEARQPHGGIILSNHLPYGLLLRRLLLLIRDLGDEDLSDRLIRLHGYKRVDAPDS